MDPTDRYLSIVLTTSRADFKRDNPNTAFCLIGSEDMFPINLCLQVWAGSTPIIDTLSFLMILGASIVATAIFNSVKKRRFKAKVVSRLS